MDTNQDNKICRRDLIKKGVTGCAACMILPMFAGKGNDDTIITESDSDFYRINRNEYIKIYRNYAQGFEQLASLEMDQKTVKQISKEAESYFLKLYDNLPDIGGKKNLNTDYLIIAAAYLSFYPAMKKAGKTDKDLGKIFLMLNEGEWQNKKPDELKQMQNEFFSEQYKQAFKNYAQWTQQKKHPMNWIAEYKEGNGTDFDWGYNYTECAVVDYLKAQKAPELAYYFCLTDFTRSKAIGTGLEREHTLAAGDSLCDFRYKRGRTVEKDWKMELYET